VDLKSRKSKEILVKGKRPLEVRSKMENTDLQNRDSSFWTTEREVILFENLEKFPPFGVNRQFNLLNLAAYMARMTGLEYTPMFILEHLQESYNLESKVDLN
jgi:methyltransferase-like protein